MRRLRYLETLFVALEQEEVAGLGSLPDRNE